MPKLFQNTDFFIRGESEFVLCEIADYINDIEKVCSLKGIVYKNGNEVVVNPKQELISYMDKITRYDYSVFEDQIFFRPYNGEVERAVDYELSRGCIYACSYCVESVIQSYYGFTRAKHGVLIDASKYLRCKSAGRVFSELKELHEKYGITLIRSQDANFLTIKHDVLVKLAELICTSKLDIKIYIETRPEGINEKSIKLLKKLKVDGVGIGIEASTESFRKNSLNRFAPQEKIVEAFKMLKQAGIKRTAYNIIGLPEQKEEMIIETIKFNQLLDPDSVTAAFYSPYIGTREQKKSKEMEYFDDYEYNVDGQLRSVSKSTLVSMDILNFYKKNFVHFVRDGLDDLPELKKREGLE